MIELSVLLAYLLIGVGMYAIIEATDMRVPIMMVLMCVAYLILSFFRSYSKWYWAKFPRQDSLGKVFQETP